MDIRFYFPLMSARKYDFITAWSKPFNRTHARDSMLYITLTCLAYCCRWYFGRWLAVHARQCLNAPSVLSYLPIRLRLIMIDELFVEERCQNAADPKSSYFYHFSYLSSKFSRRGKRRDATFSLAISLARVSHLFHYCSQSHIFFL